MNALRALCAVFFGDLRRSPGAALATLAAMAAGVGVFVAVYLAGAAAESSFVSAVEAAAGKATHEITSPAGLDERRLPDFVSFDGVEAVQPVVEGRALLREIQHAGAAREASASPLRLLGVDPFFVGPFLSAEGGDPVVPRDLFTRFLTEPGACVLPKRWADEAGVNSGDALTLVASGKRHVLRVLTIYDLQVLGEAARDTALVDIASAQEIFGMSGRLTRVELILREDAKPSLAHALTPGEQLQRPARRGERVGKMIEAFRLNLLALGLLALVVGALLVYNAAQFRVVRRAGLYGQLRCLGVTRPQLMAAALGEVVLLGFLGGGLGLAAGTALAQGLVTPNAQTVTELYAFVRVDAAKLDPLTGLLVVLAACAVAAAAGFFPALDAARTPPRLVGLRSHGEQRFRAQLPRLLLGAAGCGVVLAAAVYAPLRGFWPGFVAAFALLGLGAALLPVVMALVLPVARRMGEHAGLTGLALAAGALDRSLSRTGGAASALGAALAMTVGVIVMVHSFEQEVRGWIVQAIRADIFVADAAEQSSRETTRIPPEALDLIRATPGVLAIDTLRAVEVPYGDRTIRVVGVELPTAESRARFQFIEGDERALDEALAGAAIISEPLANHYGLRLGDFLELPGAGPGGRVRLRVAGVFRDFSYDRGYALTGKAPFIAAFGDPGVANTAVYVEPGVNLEDVARRLREQFRGRFALVVRSNADLRARILEIFERTFAITYLLQVVATVMALAGTAVTLIGLFLERAREVATLRALGTTLAGIGKLFAAESLLMALFPCLLALPLGAALGWVLIHVVNLRSFGWTIGFAWPWPQVLATCGLAACASLLATLAPLALARRQSIAAALREE